MEVRFPREGISGAIGAAIGWTGCDGETSVMNTSSIMERDGVVPSKIVQVCCTVNKKGNKRAMNTFYYCYGDN